MAYDAAIAAFFLNEYRTSAAENAGVLADYPNARQVEASTNLDAGGAAALAAELLALLEVPARAFEVEVSGAAHLTLADFDGTPPAFTLLSERFQATGGETLLPAAIEMNFDNDVATWTLRG